MKDDFDQAFDELIEKGFVEEVGKDADGEPKYRFTAKARAAADWQEIAEKTARLLRRATALSN